MNQGPKVDGHGHDNKREEEGWFPTFRTTFIHCQGFILHLILFNSMFLKYKMCNQVIFTYKLRKEGYKKLGKVPNAASILSKYTFLLGHWFKHEFSYTDTQVTNHPLVNPIKTRQSSQRFITSCICCFALLYRRVSELCISPYLVC